MNPTTTHSSEVVGQLVLIETDPIRQRVKHAIAEFLAGYSGTTLEAYRLDLRGWVMWLDTAFLDPFEIERAHIELYARWCESEGKARSTIGRRLSTICGFYRYCSQERLIERDPSAHVRRPASEAGLRVIHPRSRSQRTRRVPRPSRVVWWARPCARLPARAQRAAHLRSARSGHRQSRREPWSSDAVHPSQGQQDRHDPAVTEDGAGARPLHRRPRVRADLHEPRPDEAS